MNIIAVIPVRMGSSRFPGKPLKKINGVPMVEMIYNNIKKNKNLTKVVVATCDRIIFDFIKSINGNVVLTSKKHKRATERTAEAVKISEKKYKKKFSIVVMVQGDEPMTHPNMIKEAVQPMIEDSSIQVTNLMGQIKTPSEFEDRNCIKVVCDLNSNAMYFSREPIPTKSKVSEVPMGKQVCVIPFRRDYLIEYTKLKPTPLEIVESIDMMRILEHGMSVRMVPTIYDTQAVDTPEDLQRVERLIQDMKG
jgi:3-deoxy-manno-octulosonate cytidylyltransferase (CMP-KDO synthetase)